jgi:hypothetical protein
VLQLPSVSSPYPVKDEGKRPGYKRTRCFML